MNNTLRTATADKIRILSLPDQIVWCGSIVEDENGVSHLFFSHWDARHGFEAWCTRSRIGYARADSPDGPFQFEKTILPDSRGPAWQRDVAHNPTAFFHDGRFYLYFMGNYGDGEFWTHRNHQNIGVASAADPRGEWKISGPLLSDDQAVLFSNPTVCRRPDGKFLMIYKWVAKQRPAPFYGPVRHGVAMADWPEGPFSIIARDLFQISGIDFPGEDPFLFYRDGSYFCILKDNGQNYSTLSRGLIRFRSPDGIHWTDPEGVLSRRLIFDDGSKRRIYRLERPQLLFRHNGEVRLLCAAKPSKNSDHTFLVSFDI